MSRKTLRSGGKKYTHKDHIIDEEFENIYRQLSKINLGPFEVYYSEELQALYIRESIRNGGKKVVLKINSYDHATNPSIISWRDTELTSQSAVLDAESSEVI
jgi:peptidyl-tRNA hydrolase